MDSKIRVMIYSQPQEVERLNGYAESKGYRIADVFNITDDSNQVHLLELMKYIVDNDIDKLIVPTCSTLSMKPAELVRFINGLNDAGISVVIVNNNEESLLPNGRINPTFRFMLDILYELDSVKKRATRKRFERSYIRYRENGGLVGRKTGYRKSRIQYKREYWRELNLLRDGLSLKKCHRETSTSVNTLRKLKSMFL
ncbi:MAG: recombinase family protein [Paramuribaculum sp.]|nr:recombinase family protein [Paramuribaculum sp.]